MSSSEPERGVLLLSSASKAGDLMEMAMVSIPPAGTRVVVASVAAREEARERLFLFGFEGLRVPMQGS